MSEEECRGVECLLVHAGVVTIATGLPSICRYLRNANVNAEILRITPAALDSLADDAARFEGLRLIGISMHWHPQAPISIKIAELFRALPETRRAKILLGGMTASYFAEELIRLPFVDFVIQGDGELPMLLLFQSLCGGGPELSAIPNLYFKRNGEVARSQGTYCIDDETLGALERQVIEEGGWFSQTRSVLSIGRGCDHGCAYCGGSRHGFPKWSGRSAAMRRSEESVKASIAALLKQGAQHLFLLHDYDGRLDTLSRCLQDFDLSALKTVAVDAWGLPGFENLQRMFAGTSEAEDLVVTLELSPDSGDEEVRGRVRSCSYTNAELTDFMDRAFARYGNIRIVLCFSYFLPQTEKRNLVTRDFINRLTRTYLRQIIENRLQIQFWPLSTDPGSSIQQGLVDGLMHDVHNLTDYVRAMMAMKSSCGNFLRHRPVEMDAAESDFLRRLFTYENALRLLYPVLYLNIIQLFDAFDAYDAFLRRCFDSFHDIYLRDSSTSALHAQHVSLETSSMFGFTFSGDEALPKLSLVLAWLSFIERELRRLAEESPSSGRCLQAVLSADLISPLSTDKEEFGRFSGVETVVMDGESLLSYVREMASVVRSRERFRLGQASRKKPLFQEILRHNDQKIRSILDRGLHECDLLPVMNVLCEIIPIRHTPVIIPPLRDSEALRLLGPSLFEKLICGTEGRDGGPSGGEEARSPGESDPLVAAASRAQELWTSLLSEDDLSRALVEQIVSIHVPVGLILARLGIPPAGDVASVLNTTRPLLSDLYGVLSDLCDIRLLGFYLNHLKVNGGCRDMIRPGTPEAAILTSIYYPEPGTHEGAFVFTESLSRLEREVLRLCDGTRTLAEITRELKRKSPDGGLSDNVMRDMMVSLYSRQIIC